MSHPFRSVMLPLFFSLIVLTTATSQEGLDFLGRITAEGQISSAIAIVSPTKQLFIVYTCNGEIAARKQNAASGEFEPCAIGGLSDIHGARDLRAYNRFMDDWMAFFVAADGTGREAIRALEFDEKGNLVIASFGVLAMPESGDQIGQYEVKRNILNSFYVLVRKEDAVGIFYIDESDKNVVPRYYRQSIDANDKKPIGMTSRMDCSDFFVEVDYECDGSNSIHSNLLVLKNGILLNRQDLGRHTEAVRAIRTYRTVDDILLGFLRNTGIVVKRYSKGMETASWECYQNGKPLDAFEFSDEHTLLVTLVDDVGANLIGYSIESGVSRQIFGINQAVNAFAAYRLNSSSSCLEYLVAGERKDGSLDIKTVSRPLSSADWQASRESSFTGQSLNPVETIKATYIDQPEQGIAIVSVQSADNSISIITIKDQSAGISSYSLPENAPMPSDLLSGQAVLSNYGETSMVTTEKYCIVFKKDAAYWLPLGPSGSADNVRTAIISSPDSDSLTVYKIKG
jgi:hypothetical protein